MKINIASTIRMPILLSLVAVGSMLAAWQLQPQAQASAPTYTAAQASLGKAAYEQSCASCHGPNLDDGPFGPPLKGVQFIQKYGGKSADGLFTVTSTTMPTASPGSLGASTYPQILAYVPQANAIVAGTRELPSDTKLLASMTMPNGGFSFMAFSPYAPTLPAVNRPNPLDTFTPVTDALLANPPATDWLSWRRTYDAHGFSPLKQIDKTNVGSLRVAWSWALPTGANEATPLVHDGVIFVHGFGDRAQALDAKTGDLLWQYARQLPEDSPRGTKRAIALYGDRVYVGTSDVHVVALEARTGKVVWDQEIGDYRVREGLSGGPLVAKGKVMVGTTGTGVGAKPGGPQIVGLDAQTGTIAGRVHTIAQPGEPGGDSWNGVPIEQRSGASV